MKKVTMILLSVFLMSMTIPATADSESPQSEAAISSPVVAPEPGPIVRKMSGKLTSLDVTKKTFKITPNNIGEPIAVMCEPGPACSVDGLVEGIDGNVEVYYQNEKWIAKTVKQEF